MNQHVVIKWVKIEKLAFHASNVLNTYYTTREGEYLNLDTAL